MAWYRLGENDPGAVHGLGVTNSIDVVGSRVLVLAGGPLYETNVLASGSSLGVRFSSGTWGTNALVSTLVNNFGLELWVNPSTVGGNHMLVYNGHSANNGWGLNLANGFYSGLYGGQAFIGSVPAATNVWTHLALVCSGGITTLYTNGVVATVTPITPAVPAGLFGVANAPNPPGSALFQGLLDEVRVFTFAPGQFNTNDLLLNIPPSVTTTGPTMQINDTATLNGTVNPGERVTTVWFEWGTAAFNYTQQTAPVTVGGAVALPVSNILSGLTPGIIYQYRAVGSNAAGIVRGKDVRFGSPAILLIGPAPLTNECHFAFNDPGATAFGAPLAIAGGNIHNLALRSDGTVAAWGNNTYGQTNIPVGLSNVVAIAGGGVHSLALRNDGTVAAWGYDVSGQTNIPVGLSNVVAIAGGTDHSLALRSDGTVAAWGGNSYGQTNIPVGLSNVVAIAGGSSHSLALRSDGTVAAWGYNTSGQTNIPVGLNNVVAIAGRGDHSLALRSDGTVAAWGNNTYGQTTVPVGLGSLAMTVSGSVNTNSSGSYLLTYTSTNVLGGVGQVTRTVVVLDTLAPVITLLGNNPILITNVSNLPLNDPGATAFDLCDGGHSVTASNAVNVNFPGVYSITYHSTDSSGNLGLATRTVIVALPPAVPGDQNGDSLVNQSELDAVYARYVTNSPWLYMTNVAALGETDVTFALSNSSVGNYSVEVSTNLADWTLLGPAVPRFLFTDTNAGSASQRYYRLRWP